MIVLNETWLNMISFIKNRGFLGAVAIYLLLVCLQPVSAEQVLTEQAIRLHLASMEDGNITDAEKQEILLDTYMQFAQLTQNKSLQALVASDQAGVKFSLGKLNEAEEIIEQYFSYAREFHETEVLISFYYLQSKIAGRRSERQLALDIADQMLDLAIASKNESKIADAYILIGQLLTSANRLEEALDYLQKASLIFDKLNDQLGISVTNSSIASLYTSLNEPNKAIEYYQRALVYLKQSGERFNESIVLFNIGLAHLNLEGYSEAKNNFEQAMALSIELKDDLGIAYAKTRLAKIENIEGNKEIAIKHLTEALPIFEQSKDTRMVYVTSISLATTYSEIGDYQSAIEWHRPLLEMAKKLENRDFEVMYYRSLSEIKANSGFFKEAYEATKPYIKVLQEQHDNEKNKSLTEVRVKFDTEQKEKENLLLIKDNELKQLKLNEEERKNTINYLFIMIIAVVAIVISVLLYKQIQLRKMYRNMAMRDELTGAYNRRAILAFADARLQEATASDSHFTVALLDLDWFKQFNDQYGHNIGDEVLKVFAQAAQSAIRTNDRLGRFGGEEWLYVLPDTSKFNIEIIFNRVNEQLAKVHIIGLPKEHKITFSMGVASLSGKNRKLNELIKEADQKLYQAKEAGRNRYIA